MAADTPPAPGTLTLDRVFASPDLSGPQSPRSSVTGAVRRAKFYNLRSRTSKAARRIVERRGTHPEKGTVAAA